MTGRARGRSRGRGRASVQQQEPARRPGEAEASMATQTPVGRGRSRGPPPQVVSGPPPPRPQEQRPAAAAAAAPPTQQMARMSMQQEPRGAVRRGPYQEPVTRPAHITNKAGATGSKVPILTNHFKLTTRPNFTICQYNVSFSPEVEFKKARLGLVGAQRELLGDIRAFDGMILYLPRKLPDQVTRIPTMRKRRGTDEQPIEEPVEIIITLTNELPSDSPMALQVYNVIFRRILKFIGMQQVGRNYFHVSRAIGIPQHKMELWPGYTTSILPYEEDIYLCADVSHKVLRTDTVLEFLYDLYQRSHRAFHEEAQKKLIGEIVLTRYNNKTYRIDDILWDSRPHHTFETKRGPITYIEYYQKTYERTITDMDQPLLVSKPKKIPGKPLQEGPLHLLPELCVMTGISDDTRANFQVMKDLAVHTRIPPKERNTSLQGFIDDINSNPEAANELMGWNLQFERSAENVEGRVLPGEVIYQGSKRYNYNPREAEWTKEMRGNSLTSTVNLENWILVHTNRDTGIAKDFVQTLQRVCGPMGIKCSNPKYIPLPDDRTDSYLMGIKREMEDATQMVITIVPTNRKDRYDSIKKLCCLERPVPSQVIVSRTLSKKQMLMSVCTKIGIQLNCKLGGEAWAVEIPLKKLMVVGVDTYHDSATKGQSVGGFVATLNQTLTKYYSRVTFQHTGMELVDQLKVCMTAALRQYQEVNGELPERIILYRDGVGDGQLPAVVEHEVPQLLECFKTLQSGVAYNPKFALIVVKKRISTRLFLKDQRNNLNNPQPGTIVDTKVTRKEWFDFFLVSQSVRQGTVTPTHYNVIHDNTLLKPDHFQRLTYKLTHLYYNWPGTVRVPAPCQYAHKLAFLVGQSLHKAPHLQLADKLFFL